MAGHPQQIGQGLSAHLLHQFTTMQPDGSLADPDLGTNLLVHIARRYQGHHFPLTRIEGLEPPPQLRHHPASLPVGATGLDRHSHRIQKVLLANGLRQELDGPCFHGLHRHRDIAVSRKEDNRYLNTGPGEL